MSLKKKLFLTVLPKILDSQNTCEYTLSTYSPSLFRNITYIRIKIPKSTNGCAFNVERT